MRSPSHYVPSLLFAAGVSLSLQCGNQRITSMEKKPTIEESKDYIGVWVTADGYIRHELLSNNRYDEARGNRKSAYQGNYKITGNHIDYRDDTGFTADGDFREGVLYHAGMVLYKERK
ncbi:MAG TPA: Atu4866 domain-containing protein [Chitinophagaceae bacterium]|nr:Atu4866 domain-containing protein [Chitinophagaceae bacterium]